MDDKVILADLRERFGSKVYLTIADLAELYGTTPMAMYHKRHRGRWPFGDFADTEGSGQILVSIYKVAEVLAFELERSARKKKTTTDTKPSPVVPRRKMTLKQASRAIALARQTARELSLQADAMSTIVKLMEQAQRKTASP